MRKIYNLTTPQKNILNLQEYYPESAISNQCGAVIYNTPKDTELLMKAVEILIKENDALRIRLKKDNGEAIQYISDENITVEVMSFDSESELDNYAEKLAQTPMRIYGAPLCRFIVFTLKEKTGIIALLNHLTADAWSFSLLINKLDGIYSELSALKKRTTDIKLSYTSFISSDMEYRSSVRYQRDAEFWEERYKNIPERSAIKLSDIAKAPTAKRITRRLPEALSSEIKACCERNEATPAIVFEAALILYLSKINRESSSVTIGIPVLNRNTKSEKNTAGMFISTIPLTVRVDKDKSVGELIKSIAKAHTAVFRHQRYPYSDILKSIRESYHFEGNLYEVLFSFQNAEADAEARTRWYFSNSSEVPLALHIDNRDKEAEYTVNADYQTGIFRDKKEVEYLLDRLNYILGEIIRNDKKAVRSISILPDKEKDILINSFNDTKVEYPKNKCVQELFCEQVKKTPDKTALVFEDKSFTYRQLDEMSNSLAWTLRMMGVQRNEVIPIMAKRDWRIIVAMLGVLKAGGAYMPISPDYPDERIKTMLEIAESRIVLSYGYAGDLTIENKDNQGTDIYRLDLADYDFSLNTNSIENINQPEDLCYIIFTSGSTGKPKGVSICHYNAVNYSDNNGMNVRHHIIKEKYTSIVSVTNIVFDIFVTESLLPLLNGLKIVLANDDEVISQNKLAELIDKNDIDVIQTTPTKMRSYLLDKSNTSYLQKLKAIVLGGEAFPNDLYTELRKFTNAEIFNIYGPAETTVWSSNAEVTDEKDITIGKPIANTQIYILDEDRNICLIGVAGELCIAGDGVGKGYLNQPELTAERFIPNPFATEENGHGKIMYRTGDLARWRTDGEIEYLGRIDTQVKIRGLRIELGEIESVMSGFEGIALCAVDAKRDESGRQYLVGYYTATGNSVIIDEKALRKHLASKLPKYMVPNYFVCLSEMPMTPSGKTDRKNLPVHEFKAGNDYVAPETKSEAKLAEIWERLFKLEKVGRYDDFFDLGGDSLLAMSLVNEIEGSFGVSVKVSDIFENPALKDMAVFIENSDIHTTISITDKTSFELLPQQKAIYASYAKDKEALTYNIPAKLPLPKDVDRKRLINAVIKVYEKYKILHCRIVERDNDIYAEYVPDIKLEIEECGDDTNFFRAFDLEKSPLMRVGITDSALLFDTHHIIMDGGSLSLFLEAVVKAYKGERLDEEELWYADYAEYFKTIDFSEHKKFFKDMLCCDFEPVVLPEKEMKSAEVETGGISKFYGVPVELFAKAKVYAKENGLTDTMLFVGAFGILLSKYSGKKDVLSSIILSNRTHSETRDMLGMFVNTLPVYFRADGTVGEYFDSVKETMLGLLKYQEIPLLEITKEFMGNDISVINTQFIFQPFSGWKYKLESDVTKPQWVEASVHKYDITVELTPAEKGCRLRIEYDRAKYDTELIDKLAQAYNRIIGQLTEKKTDEKISELSVFNDIEYDLIVNKFNDTKVEYPKDKCVHELFCEQVKKTPDKTALVFEDKSFTYRQLDEMSNALAHYLREKGLKRNEVVPIIAKRSYHIIIAMLGVLKAGGAYMPISPDYPDERIKTMLEIAESRIVLSYGYSVALISDAKENQYLGNAVQWLDLAEYDFALNTNSIENINQPEDLCYIIFTSGSTGKPKGISQTHRCLTNLISWQIKSNPVKDKRVLSSTIFTFDVSIQEIFYTLLGQGCLHFTEESVKTNFSLYIEKVKQQHINTVFMTPSYLNLLREKDEWLKNIEDIYFAGEDISIIKNRIKHLSSKCKIHNQYGPAETHVVTEKIIPDETEISLGKPIANTQIYILDEDRNICPVGVAGELCIAGDGVGKGYLNQPELTAERFIPNPFATEENGHGKIMYRTGDLARWRTDGEIEYLGRIDTQVKIRGLRIELGEIESVMSGFEGIALCAVDAKRDESGRQYLVGYYTATGNSVIIDEKALRKHLASKLPKYMVPNYFVCLSEMPMTPSGKTDRKNLPVPEFKAGNDYVAPETEDEIKLCGIISKVLGVERCGVTDDFFEIGGDSLSAITFTTMAADKGIEFNLQDIFDHPTVKELCEAIRRRMFEMSDNVVLQPDKYEQYSQLLQVNKIDSELVFEKKQLGNVFLTGVTGFLGAHILDALMREETGKIYCLIRSSAENDRRGRLTEIMQYYFNNRYISEIGRRIIPIVGNIERIDLADALPEDVHTVIHAAATVKHFGQYEYFNKVNVEGTRHVVNYAKQIGARYIHISTIGVSGNKIINTDHNEQIEKPVQFDETCFYIGQALDNVYIRSKFEAERLVMDSILQNGLEAKIIRVGNLTNRSTDLKFQPNYESNAFLTRFRAFLMLRMMPEEMLSLYSEFSPVDLTADGVVKIAQYANAQTLFHLYSNRPLDNEKMLKMLKKLGIEMKAVSLPIFRTAVQQAAQGVEDAYMYEALLNDMVEYGKRLYHSEIQNKNDFTMWFMKKIGFEWNEIDEKYLKDYIEFCGDLKHV